MEEEAERREEEEEERRDEEEALNMFQRRMKRENVEVLKKSGRSCVQLERYRRKRITQSCNRLRQLLPTIPGSHINMVTVLEMTTAYLETVKGIVRAEGANVQLLSPPAELHADWLRQSHMSRELGQKRAL